MYLVVFAMAAWGSSVRRRAISSAHVDVPIGGLSPELDGYRIAHVSDLHIGNFDGLTRGKQWAARVNALAPDLVAVTGDLVTRRHGLLRRRRDRHRARWPAKMACSVSMGNHDQAEPGLATTRLIEARGSRVLRNASEVVCAGVGAARGRGHRRPHDGQGRHRSHTRGSSPRRTDNPSLSLSRFLRCGGRARRHTGPLGACAQAVQSRCPSRRDVFSLSRLARQASAGLHIRGKSRLYVNRGLGTTGPPLRISIPRDRGVHAAPRLVASRRPSGARLRCGDGPCRHSYSRRRTLGASRIVCGELLLPSPLSAGVSLLDAPKPSPAEFVTPAVFRYHPHEAAPMTARAMLPDGSVVFAGQRGERWLVSPGAKTATSAAEIRARGTRPHSAKGSRVRFRGEERHELRIGSSRGQLLRSRAPLEPLVRIGAAGTVLVGVRRDGAIVPQRRRWRRVGARRTGRCAFPTTSLSVPTVKGSRSRCPERFFETNDFGASFSELALPSAGAEELVLDESAGVVVTGGEDRPRTATVGSREPNTPCRPPRRSRRGRNESASQCLSGRALESRCRRAAPCINRGPMGWEVATQKTERPQTEDQLDLGEWPVRRQSGRDAAPVHEGMHLVANRRKRARPVRRVLPGEDPVAVGPHRDPP